MTKTNHSRPILESPCKGVENGGGGNRTRVTIPPESGATQGFLDRGESEGAGPRSPASSLYPVSRGTVRASAGGFTASVQLGDSELCIEDGALWIYRAGTIYEGEPLRQAIPKLRALLAAALLSSGHTDPTF